MRSIALRVGAAALLAFIAVAGVGSRESQAATPALPLTLMAVDEGYVVLVPGGPGQARMWGYWGKLVRPTPTNQPGPKWGSYRATCAWLADSSWGADTTKRDNRVFCTVVLSHRHGPDGLPHGGSLVAQGLVRMPKEDQGLFVRAHECSSARFLAQCKPRTLAITGGTGTYEGVVGHVDLSTGAIAMKTPS